MKKKPTRITFFKKEYFIVFIFLLVALHTKAQSYQSQQNSSKTTNSISNNNPDPGILSGSWGVRFTVSGGERLNNTTDWRNGAEEIVNKLTTIGHVFTSFTHPAHGYYYTLRTNTYVDIANEIHSGMVPSLADEQIILDVIKTFKDAGKKVILYIATDGPSARSGTPDDEEYKQAWENYYLNNAQFSGTSEEKEGQAWRLLCRGFLERFKDAGVDGYWLDHTGGIPGTVAEYVEMIREVDPSAIIATNGTIDNGSPDFFSYFEDENGDFLFVDTDNQNEIIGIDGEDENEDYRIRAFNATDPYMDYTGGHPTPLAQGAPSNSWAYEEYTFAEMAESPWDSYDGSKSTLRHAWMPMRATWTGTSSLLRFEIEQAYRFVRTLTDPGASITWGNTIKNGKISSDEMSILQEIDSRMSNNPKPNYIPYTRPNGAYLVGESITNTVKTIFFQENQTGFCGVDGTIDNNHIGYTSDGFSNTNNAKGNGIDWEILGDNGLYTFEWKYANGSSINRTANLFINGELISNEISFPSTGSWLTWSNTSISLQLDVGIKSIRLEGITTAALANIDYLKAEGPNIVRSNCNNYSEKNNNEVSNKLHAYPNPVTSGFQLSENIQSGKIYDIKGVLVKELLRNETEFDISAFTPGLYIFKVISEDGSSKLLQILKK